MAVIFGTQGRDTLPGTIQDDVIRGWAEDGDPSTDLGDELRGFDTDGARLGWRTNPWLHARPVPG